MKNFSDQEIMKILKEDDSDLAHFINSWCFRLLNEDKITDAIKEVVTTANDYYNDGEQEFNVALAASFCSFIVQGYRIFKEQGELI